MLVRIHAVLSPAEVAQCRELLAGAEWVDGNATSGPQAALAKRNMQVREDAREARAAGKIVLDALSRSAPFVSAALPLKIFPPLFNRYEGGQSFGVHIDNAIRPVRGGGDPVRTDLSATLFLSAPEDYDGGELIVEDTYGPQQVKLPAGDLVLYPASSLHRVAPVTRGARIASFFWVQSMVRDDGARALLFQLDGTIQRLAAERGPQDAAVLELTGIYHNLVRRWAEL